MFQRIELALKHMYPVLQMQTSQNRDAGGIVIAGSGVGKPPRYSVTYGGIDAFNAQTTEQKKNLSLSEVLRHQEEVHDRLIELIESVAEEPTQRLSI